MLKKFLPTLLLVTGFALPAVAATPTAQMPRSTTSQVTPPSQPTTEELYQACTQNRAETLPNPFVDVSPNHWAYKAVLTMHYCGAFRQAAPRSLFERSQPIPSSQSLEVPSQNETVR